MTPLVEGGDVVEALGERVLGRTLADGHPEAGHRGQVLIAKNTLLDETLVRLIESEGVDQVMVRSPITCATRYGVCSACYGRDLGRGRVDQHRRGGGRHRGAVDRRAGHAAHDAYLPHRWRGLASRGGHRASKCATRARIRFHHIKTVQHEKGHLVAVSRSGEIGVVDEFGRERERYKIPYGAMITVKEGDNVAAGTVIATWDPHTHPVVTEVPGFVKFQDFVDGLTVTTQVDEVTGLSSTVILDTKQRGGKDLRPTMKLLNCQGQGSDVREHRDSGGVHAAGGRAHQPRGRRQGVRGRRDRAHPAGVFEDPRHHRRSAARRGPVRSPQAEGPRDPRGEDRHGELRQGDQGQAASGHHGRRRREVRGADSEVAPAQRVRG